MNTRDIPFSRLRSSIDSSLSVRSLVSVGVVFGMIVLSVAIYISSTQYPLLSRAESVTESGREEFGARAVSASSQTPGDGRGPQITVTSPAHDLILEDGSSGTIDLRVGADDPDGVSRIDLLLDDTVIKTCLSMQMCNAQIGVQGLAPGVHTLTVTAVDQLSVTQESSVTVTRRER